MVLNITPSEVLATRASLAKDFFYSTKSCQLTAAFLISVAVAYVSEGYVG